MNRRDFITGSLAIIGGSAMSSPVKSMMGAVGTKYVPNADSWENPYVTDGLIAMWDGIWNVGLGEHDDDATIWYDLVGSNDLTVRPSCSFSENALIASSERTNKDAAGSAVPFVPGNTFTIEIGYNSTGAYIPGNTGNYELFSIGQYSQHGVALTKSGYSGLRINFKGSHGWNLNTGGTSVAVSGVRRFVLSATKSGDQALNYAYTSQNNELQPMAIKSESVSGNISTGTHVFGGANSNGSPSSQGWGAVYGYVYYVRYYSRPLTEEEIVHNYEVDKERFGV